MTQLVHIHLPGLEASDLLDYVDAGHLQTFRKLIEQGELATWASNEIYPAREITIATGVIPAIHEINYRDQVRVDGFGIESLTRQSLHSPPYWEMLDTQGVSCCVINWCATRHSHLSQGVVVADEAIKVSAHTSDLWGVPPGSVSPTGLAPLVESLRLHTEFLTEAQIRSFVGDIGQSNSYGENERIAIRVLSEAVSAHSHVTHFLDAGTQDCISACYPGLIELMGKFSSPEPSLFQGVKAELATLIDQFLARICALLPHEARLIVTGGGETSQFLIRVGPGYVADTLIDKAVGFEQVATMITGCFEVPNVSALIDAEKSVEMDFPPSDVFLRQFSGAGLKKVTPTAPQKSLIAHCLQQTHGIKYKNQSSA